MSRKKEEIAVKSVIRLSRFYGRRLHDEAAAEIARNLLKYSEERIIDAIPRMMKYKSLPSIYQMEKIFEEQYREMERRKVSAQDERPELKASGKAIVQDPMIEFLSNYYNADSVEQGFMRSLGKLQFKALLEQTGQTFDELLDEYVKRYSREDVEKLLYEHPRVMN